MTSEASGASQHYLLFVWGSVEPEVLGPYATEEERTEAARALASDEHGIFRLDASGPVEVDTFGASEIGLF